MTTEEIAQELVRQRIPRAEIEEALIKTALLHYCNITRVSIIHGISRPTLTSRMKQWGWSLKKLQEWKRQAKLKFGASKKL